MNLPPLNLRFQAVKTLFSSFHRSKRNRLKNLLLKLSGSSENIISQSKSLLIAWKAYSQRQELLFISHTLHFSFIFARISAQNRLLMQKAAFFQLFTHKNRKNRLPSIISRLFQNRIRGYFTDFRISQAETSIKSHSKALTRLFLSLNGMMKSRHGVCLRGLRSRSLNPVINGLTGLFSLINKAQKGYLREVLHTIRLQILGQRLITNKNQQNGYQLAHFLASLLQKKLTEAFFRVKGYRMKPVLRRLMGIYAENQMKNLRTAFFQWRGCLIIKKIAKRNLTNKVKGRILLSFARNEPALGVPGAFRRWKVRASRPLIKKTMDRFALTAKVSLLTVYFRFRSLLEPVVPPKNLKKKEGISKMRLLATVKLSFLMISKQKTIKQLAFQLIKADNKRKGELFSLRSRLLSQILKKRLKGVLGKGLERWRNALKNYTAKQRFLMIVQRTKASQTLLLFNLWRKATEARDGRRGSLQGIISGFLQKNLRQIMERLNSANDAAKKKKLLALRELIDATEGQTGKAFNKWANYSIAALVRDQAMMKARMMNRVMEVIKDAVRGNLVACFKARNAANLRLFEAVWRLARRVERESIQRIAEFAALKKMKGTLEAVKRKTAVKDIENKVGIKENEEKRKILEAFARNAKAMKLLNAFYGSLTGSSVPRLFFERSFIPSPKNRPLIRKFQPIMSLIAGIHGLASNRSLATTFSALKDEKTRGEALKNKAIKEIIRKTNENMRKSFEKWNFMKKTEKNSEKTQKTLVFFNLLNEINRNGLFPLLNRDKAEKNRKKLIKRLILNNKAKLREAFLLWLGKAQLFGHPIMPIIRKRAVILINSHLISEESAGLKEIMLRFKIFVEKRKVLACFIMKMVEKRRKMGFEAIKADVWQRKKEKTNVFLMKLKKITASRLKFFDVKTREATNKIKNRILGGLISNFRGGMEQAVYRWRSENREARLLRRYQLINGLYGTINDHLTAQIRSLYDSWPSNRLKSLRNVLFRLEKKTEMQILKAFEQWKQGNLFRRISVFSSNSEKTTRNLGFLSQMLTNQLQSRIKSLFKRLSAQREQADARKASSLRAIIEQNRGLMRKGVEKIRMEALLTRNNAKSHEIMSFFDVLGLIFNRNMAVLLLKDHKESLFSKTIEKTEVLARFLSEKQHRRTLSDVLGRFSSGNRSQNRLKKGFNLLESPFLRRKALLWGKIREFVGQQPQNQLKMARKLAKTIKKVLFARLKTCFQALSSQKTAIFSRILNVFEGINSVFASEIEPVFEKRDFMLKKEAAKAFSGVITRIIRRKVLKTLDLKAEIEKRACEAIERIERTLMGREIACLLKIFKKRRDFGVFIRKIAAKINKNIRDSFQKLKKTAKNSENQALKGKSLLFRLEKLSKNRIFLVFQSIQVSNLDSTTKKKHFLAYFIRKTAEKQHFCLNLWLQASRFDRLGQAKRSIISLFEDLQNIYEGNMAFLFENRAKKSQIHAFLRKMRLGYNIKQSQAFQKLRENAREAGFKAEKVGFQRFRALEKVGNIRDLRRKQEKTTILALFLRKRLKIERFAAVLGQIEAKKTLLLRKALTKMGKNKGPAATSFFSLISTIKNLTKLRLADGLSGLKTGFFEGKEAKKSAFLAMERARRTKIEGFFLFWRFFVRKQRTFDANNAVSRCFSALNSLFGLNLNVFYDYKQEKDRRSEVLNRMAWSIREKLRNGLHGWRDIGKRGNEHHERAKKAYKISQMNTFSLELEKLRKRMILMLFYRNYSQKRAIFRLRDRILGTFAGEVSRTFGIWRGVANKRVSEYEKPTNLMRTVRIFKKIGYFGLHKTFQEFERGFRRGREVKMAAARGVLTALGGKRRAAFVNWLQIARNSKTLALANQNISFFEGLSSVFKQQIGFLFRATLKEDSQREAALRRLISGFRRGLREKMLVWLGNAQIAQVEAENRENNRKKAILAIDAEARGRENYEKTLILWKFTRNREKVLKTLRLLDLLALLAQKTIKTGFKSLKKVAKTSAKPSKTIDFLMKTAFFLTKTLKSRLLEGLKAASHVSESRKRELLLLFLKKNELRALSALNTWEIASKTAKTEGISRHLGFFFDSLQGVFEASLRPLWKGVEGDRKACELITKTFMRKRREIIRKTLGIQAEKQRKNEVFGLKMAFFLEKTEKMLEKASENEKKRVLQAFFTQKRRVEQVRRGFFGLERLWRGRLKIGIRALGSQGGVNPLERLISGLNTAVNARKRLIFGCFCSFSACFGRLKGTCIEKMSMNSRSLQQEALKKWFFDAKYAKGLMKMGAVGRFSEVLREVHAENIREMLVFDRKDTYSRNFIEKINRIIRKKLEKTIFGGRNGVKGDVEGCKTVVFLRACERVKDRLKEAFYRWKGKKRGPEGGFDAKAWALGGLLKKMETVWKKKGFRALTRPITLSKALSPLKSLSNRLLRLVFERIRQHSEAHLLKTYLNSLWKWKLANMEARLASINRRKLLRLAAFSSLSAALEVKTRENKAFGLYCLRKTHKSLGLLEKAGFLTDFIRKKRLFEAFFAIKKAEMSKIRVFSGISKLFAVFKARIQAEKGRFIMKIAGFQQKRSPNGLISVIERLFRSRKTAFFLILRTFSLEKHAEIRRKLVNFASILTKKREFRLQSGFSSLTGLKTRLNGQERLKGLIKLLLMASNVEKYRLAAAFARWRAADPNRRNPWFLRAIGILAKDAMLNPQIAYWRLRDFRKKRGLTAPQAVKVKKMLNNLTKAFEQQVSWSFWRLESHKKALNFSENSIFGKGRYRVLARAVGRLDLLEGVRIGFERMKVKDWEIGSPELRGLFGDKRLRKVQRIGAAFQMAFVLNKTISNARIKGLNFALKRFSKAIKNGFYSPVERLASETDDPGEVFRLREAVSAAGKELELKDEQLSAAQECIEIIHDKLKQVLLRRMGELVEREVRDRMMQVLEALRCFN